MKLNKILLILIAASTSSCQSEAQTTDVNCKISKMQLAYVEGILVQTTTSVREFNQSLFERIVIEVASKGNRSYDSELVVKANKVIRLTDELFDNLDKIKIELNKSLDFQQSVEHSNRIIFEEGKGQRIKVLLDNYIDSINGISKNRHLKIFPEFGEEYDEIELFFKNSTTAGSIGIITSFQTQASNIESLELFSYARMTGTR
jgi:hypothetical protein